MNSLKLTLKPLTDLGTPLAGDTLFGQLCWAVRERFGENRLSELLVGYDEGRPFAVMSDGFPSGFVPRPSLPDFLLSSETDPAKRKQLRSRAWLPAGDAGLPMREWLNKAQSASVARISVLTQNTINRHSGTTGTGPFAPRQVERLAYPHDARLDVYIVLDESRFHLDEFEQVIEDIGNTGFGRDASTGLGKFAIESVRPHNWVQGPARHWLTLASCAPVADTLEADKCYYQPVTRFGRHGNIAVLMGAPFKRPVLQMRTAASVTTREVAQLTFLGSGLGGTRTPISMVIPQTVHQGYAPVLPLNTELT
jgi:CRISPR-associated protein Csm4